MYVYIHTCEHRRVKKTRTRGGSATTARAPSHRSTLRHRTRTPAPPTPLSRASLRYLDTATRCNTLHYTALHCMHCKPTVTRQPEMPRHCNIQCNIHCNTLQRTLQHTAIHCNTLQRTATPLSCTSPGYLDAASHTATHCSTLQHTATHCNTLQHTATYCSALQHTALHCTTLHHTAPHCTTLHHTATH